MHVLSSFLSFVADTSFKWRREEKRRDQKVHLVFSKKRKEKGKKWMSAATLKVPAATEERDKTEAGSGTETTTTTTTTTTSKDTVRDVAEAEGTASFSSERFDFVGLEEHGVVDSIDRISQLFTRLTKKPPTLEEALACMGYEKAKELAEQSTEKATDKLTELYAPDLTVEDVAVIFCYTLEWNEKRLGDGESPHKKLNNSLSVDRSSAALKKTRGFLFLLLQALRKLPRFVPESHTLYRGIRAHVQTEPDPEFPDRKPYAAGNKKTWWAFTSTTTSLEATRKFICNRESTLFVVGKSPWGYDISVFSDFPDEKEILLEPERKLKVTGVVRQGQHIIVNAEMVDTPLILEKIVKAPKHVKAIKAKKSKVKEVPESLKAENATDKTVELSWRPVDVKGKTVMYRVAAKQAGVFNRATETVYEGTEGRCTVGDLEQWTEYEFFVRCGYDGGWGKWSERVIAKTKAISNLTAKAESWDTIRLTWDPVTPRFGNTVGYTLEMKKEGESEFTEIYNGTKTKHRIRRLLPDTEHSFRARAVCGNETSEWSEAVQGTTQGIPEFSECVWKECPCDVKEERKYSLGEKSPRIATKAHGNGLCCTLIGSTPFPQNKVTPWSIRVLKSKYNDGGDIYIGVAPSGIDQNESCGYEKSGWHIHCYDSTLYSGPPHYHWNKEYGPRKGDGKYVHTGDSVGVVMDTTKGELSFAVDGVNLGVVYDGIPLDKPLVPCVFLCNKGDSVELVI